MTASPVRVVRASPGLVWRALDGAEVVGAARAFLWPNDRWFVSFDQCRADCYRPLLAAIAANTGADLYTVADEDDGDALALLAELGFGVHRVEGIYLIPSDPAITGLTAGSPPGEFVIKSALDVDEEQLRLLDEALREDVPGTEGWRWDPGDFHEETFSPSFDPATYLVAVDLTDGEYAGLVRVWIDPGRPRLGLLAVLRPYRRAGLARALLGRAFGVLHERGLAMSTAEVDDANTAMVTLMARIGGQRKNGSVELIKRLP